MDIYFKQALESDFIIFTVFIWLSRLAIKMPVWYTYSAELAANRNN